MKTVVAYVRTPGGDLDGGLELAGEGPQRSEPQTSVTGVPSESGTAGGPGQSASVGGDADDRRARVLGWTRLANDPEALVTVVTCHPIVQDL